MANRRPLVWASGGIRELPSGDTLPDDALALTPADVGAQPADANLSAIAGLSPSNDDVLQRKAGSWVNRTLAQLKTDLALAASDIVSGVFAIARIPTGTTSSTVCIGNDSRLSDSRAPTGTAGGALNGTYPNPNLDLVPWAPVALTDGATINTDASLSNHFTVSMAGNRTFAAPTNPTNGQRILYELTASSADRTPTFATGSAGQFKFGTDITTVGVIASGTTCLVGAIYNSTADRWRIVAVVKGY